MINAMVFLKCRKSLMKGSDLAEAMGIKCIRTAISLLVDWNPHTGLNFISVLTMVG